MSGAELFIYVAESTLFNIFYLRTKSLLTLGEDVFYVSECKGEGGFAKVFAASKQETEGDCWCSSE